MIVTGVPAAFSSRSAFTAPAWMAFQNSCVVPFGMTASFRFGFAGSADFAGSAAGAGLGSGAGSCFLLQAEVVANATTHSAPTQHSRVMSGTVSQNPSLGHVGEQAALHYPWVWTKNASRSSTAST
jgi:hypothetical protein